MQIFSVDEMEESMKRRACLVLGFVLFFLSLFLVLEFIVASYVDFVPFRGTSLPLIRREVVLVSLVCECFL